MFQLPLFQLWADLETAWLMVGCDGQVTCEYVSWDGVGCGYTVEYADDVLLLPEGAVLDVTR